MIEQLEEAIQMFGEELDGMVTSCAAKGLKEKAWALVMPLYIVL